MFVISRTHARWAFKDLLGQANHFLITILVGLNGIKANQIEMDPEFSTSWNPHDPKRSAERSRVFALDLALVRAVDALDTYFMMSVRKPCALADESFVAAMGATSRSVANRLDVFDEHLPSLEPSQIALLKLAIEWRNRRVHSLAEDRFVKAQRQLILAEHSELATSYSGLDVKALLTHFDGGMAPTFKEAASIIRACHQAVEHYDSHILSGMPLTRYLCDSVLMILSEGNSDYQAAINRIWDHPKRRAKALRLLRLAGVSEGHKRAGRRVTDCFVESFVSLTPQEVEDFLMTAHCDAEFSS